MERIWLAFLDLDGTILDENYSFQEFLPILEKMKEKGFEIVLNSNKTFDEMLYFWKELKLNSPFIVESGSAIFIPKGRISEELGEEYKGFRMVKLGVDFERIEEVMRSIEEKLGGIKRFTRMSPEEIAKITGLPLFLAEKAKKRMFTEVIPKQERLEEIRSEVLRGGLDWKPGRTLNVVGGKVDKGTATKKLIEIYSRYYEVKSLGAGDSWTDLPMVNSVDMGFYISSKEPPEGIEKGVVLVRNREELIKELGEKIDEI